MTFSNLEDEVKERIVQCLSDKKFLTEKGGYSSMNVKTGFLPPENWKIKDKETEELLPYEEYPLIQILTKAGTDISKSESKVHIHAQIVVALEKQKQGEYNLDPIQNGHKDILSIIQRIRKSMQENPTIGESFTFDYPFEWVIPKKQPLNHRQGSIDMYFNVGSVNNNSEEDLL